MGGLWVAGIFAGCTRHGICRCFGARRLHDCDLSVRPSVRIANAFARPRKRLRDVRRSASHSRRFLGATAERNLYVMLLLRRVRVPLIERVPVLSASQPAWFKWRRSRDESGYGKQRVVAIAHKSNCLCVFVCTFSVRLYFVCGWAIQSSTQAHSHLPNRIAHGEAFWFGCLTRSLSGVVNCGNKYCFINCVHPSDRNVWYSLQYSF